MLVLTIIDKEIDIPIFRSLDFDAEGIINSKNELGEIQVPYRSVVEVFQAYRRINWEAFLTDDNIIEYVNS